MRYLTLALVIVGAACLTLVAACGGPAAAAAPRPITVRGTLVVSDPDDGVSGCDYSDTGYSDIDEGAQVTVTSPSGTVIGNGALEAGVPEQGTDCEFPFTVAGVKRGLPRYGVTVSHRGTIWFSPSEIASASLTLGG